MFILLTLEETACLAYRVLTAGLTNSRTERKFGIRKHSLFLCREKKMPVVPENCKTERNDVTVIFLPNDLSLKFFGYLYFYEKKKMKKEIIKKEKQKSLTISPEFMFWGDEGMTTYKHCFLPENTEKVFGIFESMPNGICN